MPIPPTGPGPDLPALAPSGGDTAPTMPFLPPRPSRPRLDALSPRERGVAVPRGLGAMSRNMRLIVITLSVLLLAGCCTLSWSAASAIFPPPGAPVALASGSPTASDTASATDQPTATDSGTPTTGSDATPTPSVGPTSTPTAPPLTPTAAPCPDPYNNPWGYNFCPGTLITGPTPNAFCSVFRCAYNYSRFGPGYVVECADGRFSHGGGNVGACKLDGKKVLRPLYQHPTPAASNTASVPSHG